jgi:hypothetical protein
MIVGPLIPPGAAQVAVAVVVACVTTRWVAPTVLSLLARSVQGTVAAIAALIILPEYYLSITRRRRQRRPPQLAYDYGATIGWIALQIHRAVGFLIHGLAAVLRAIPMIWVAILAAGLTIGSLLGLIVV